jgi:hypothetical protein
MIKDCWPGTTSWSTTRTHPGRFAQRERMPAYLAAATVAVAVPQ